MPLICGSPALSDLHPEFPRSRFVEYEREIGGACDAISVGKFRNGAPKVWCKTHAAVIKGDHPKGCARSSQRTVLRCVSIQVDGYSGGIGIWGSLPPALDTADASTDVESLSKGIHVHARPQPTARKEIDLTYDLVALYRGSQLLVVLDTGSATSLVQARIAGLATELIQCNHCGADHIDEGWFAVTPHRKHQCLCCGREFYRKNLNAGSAVESRLEEIFPSRARTPANRRIDLTGHLRKGRGVRLWGTHQALAWTAGRPEESGIHVHVYNERGEYVVDETFDSVSVGSYILDAAQVRFLMLQRSLEYLDGRVADVICSGCGISMFFTDRRATNPSRRHECDTCGSVTPTRMKVVSNPLARVRLGNLL